RPPTPGPPAPKDPHELARLAHRRCPGRAFLNLERVRLATHSAAPDPDPVGEVAEIDGRRPGERQVRLGSRRPSPRPQGSQIPGGLRRRTEPDLAGRLIPARLPRAGQYGERRHRSASPTTAPLPALAPSSPA